MREGYIVLIEEYAGILDKAWCRGFTSLYSLKSSIEGSIIGVIKGYIWNLDHSSLDCSLY